MPDVTSLIQQAIEHYKPGGEFATVRAKQLGERKGTFTAAAESQLVGRGMGGTTLAAGIPAAFEQQVGAPWRTETEMMRGGRLMEAVLAKAGFAERETARQLEVRLAMERMNLQRELQDRSLSAQERAVKEQRLHEIEMQERGWKREEWKREQGWTGGGAAQPTYEYPSAPSLIGAGGGVGGGPGGGITDPTIGQPVFMAEGGTGVYLGGDRISAPGQADDWSTQMGKIAEQWLTEPSAARDGGTLYRWDAEQKKYVPSATGGPYKPGMKI